MTSSHPDAHVQLGKTSVTALSTAKLAVPHPDRPSKGNHFIKLFAPGFTSFHALESFEQYFRFLWRKSDIIEEGSLCLRPGEKVWSVDTKIVIHDDDGGLIDAIFVACYISLSGLGFPSFDTSTGALFPAWHRRIQRIAFSIRPLAVTIGFGPNFLLVDPSLTEMQIVKRFAVFVSTSGTSRSSWTLRCPETSTRPGTWQSRSQRVAD
jgi:exosome complex RNA-binding protein Rrp42 (RNase PH superfamily)